MNENGKNNKSNIKFNILDAIIILLVILCIAGIVFRYSIVNKLSLNQELSEYQITFTLSSVNYTLPGFLGEGDMLYFSNGEEAGELLGVSDFSDETKLTAGNETLLVTEASKYISDSLGNPVLAVYPEYTLIDATGAFLSQGAYCSEGYFCLGGDQYLAQGQKLTLYTDTVTLYVTITGISSVQ